MLKCDFHLHSREDPRDVLSYSAFDLIDHAAQLGYHVLSLTLHGKIYCPDELRHYAASKKILLIPGVEFYLDHREVLLLGVTHQDLTHLRSLDDLRTLKQELGDKIFIIAPHPYYHLRQCLGKKLEIYAEMFDAIEFCRLYTRWWNPNDQAGKVASQIGKPTIACSDAHCLQWMNDHYFLVDAQPNQEEIFTAIRKGRIKNISRPLGSHELFYQAFWCLVILKFLTWKRRWWQPFFALFCCSRILEQLN